MVWVDKLDSDTTDDLTHSRSVLPVDGIGRCVLLIESVFSFEVLFKNCIFIPFTV